MNEECLKSKALKGVVWSAIDKFTINVGSFVIGIILAGLLRSSDYSLIDMSSFLYYILASSSLYCMFLQYSTVNSINESSFVKYYY